mgnify:CR=1 FL=1
MWRMLAVLAFIAACCAIGMAVVWFVSWVYRRARRAEIRDAIDAENAKWLAQLSREDIAKHRARMNEDIDNLWKEDER